MILIFLTKEIKGLNNIFFMRFLAIFLIFALSIATSSCNNKFQKLNSKKGSADEEVTVLEDFNLPKEFWNSPKDITLAWYSDTDTAEYYATDRFVLMAGKDKPVIDYKLNRRLQDEDLEQHVRKYFLDNFKKILTSKKHHVKIAKDKLKFKAGEPAISYDTNNFDFSNITTDYVLVMNVKYFGINIEFDEDISTQVPQVVTRVEFLLYNRLDSQLLAKKSFMQIDDVQGKWDFPPIYVKMFSALAEVFRNAISDAEDWLLSE